MFFTFTVSKIELHSLCFWFPVFAVETGVMELSTDIGVCDYPLTDPDLNPAQNYNLLPSKLTKLFSQLSFPLTDRFTYRRLPSGQRNRHHCLCRRGSNVSGNLWALQISQASGRRGTRCHAAATCHQNLNTVFSFFDILSFTAFRDCSSCRLLALLQHPAKISRSQIFFPFLYLYWILHRFLFRYWCEWFVIVMLLLMISKELQLMQAT